MSPSTCPCEDDRAGSSHHVMLSRPGELADRLVAYAAPAGGPTGHDHLNVAR